MKTLKVTWVHATKIWWSLVWRSLIFGSIAAFIAGLLVGSLSSFIGHDPLSNFYGQSAGILVGIPVGILVVKIVLTKEFKGYRIVLLPSTEVMMQKSLNDISQQNN